VVRCAVKVQAEGLVACAPEGATYEDVAQAAFGGRGRCGGRGRSGGGEGRATHTHGGMQVAGAAGDPCP